MGIDESLKNSKNCPTLVSTIGTKCRQKAVSH
jgi:hypothetical protein